MNLNILLASLKYFSLETVRIVLMTTLLLVISLITISTDNVNAAISEHDIPVQNRAWWNVLNPKPKPKPIKDRESDIFHKLPTGNASLFLGVVYSNGFTTQPLSTRYSTEIDKKINIHTKFSMRHYALGQPNLQYIWFQSSDGKNWSAINTDNKNNSSDLTVTSDTPGTKYFQLQVIFSRGVYTKSYFSDVATVEFQSESHPATSISINLDDDHIYTNDDEDTEQTFNPTITPTPENATDALYPEWSLEDGTPAKINHDTGLLSVMNNAPIGEFKMFAKLPTSEVSAEKIIYIEKLLSGPTSIFSGNDAFFQLNGKQSNLKNFNISWFLSTGNSTGFKQILKQQGQSLNAKDISLNSGGIIYAHLEREDPKNTKDTIKLNSNKIAFNFYNDAPKLDTSYTLKNLTFSESNTSPNLIKQIASGDTLLHEITIADKSEQVEVTGQSGKINIPLMLGEEIREISLKDRLLTSEEYQVSSNSKQQTLIIPNISLSKNESIKIEIKSTVQVNKDANFIYSPSYTLKTISDKVMTKDFPNIDGEFISNSIGLAPSDIGFGKINDLKKHLYERVIPNEKTPILDFHDTRREPREIKVDLNFSNEFCKRDIRKTSAPIFFKFIDKNNTDITPSNRSIIINTSLNNGRLDPIYWKKNEGLRIHIPNTTILDGTYHSALTWTLCDSIC